MSSQIPDFVKQHKVPDPGILGDGFEGLWDTLRFPSNQQESGHAASPTIEPGTGCLVFEDGFTHGLTYLVQFPQGWAVGSPVHPQIHWARKTASSDAVGWKFGYALWLKGDAGSGLFPTLTGTLQAGVTDNGIASEHLVYEFNGMLDTVIAAMSFDDILLCQVSRLGASDAYSGDCRLLTFNMLYQTKANGTSGKHE